MATKRQSPGIQRFLVISALCAALAGIALACDTPVYRYAMYRWQAAPYELYFFHDAPAEGADERIAKVAKDLNRDEKRPGNLIYFDVDLAQDKDMTRISPGVKRAFLAHTDRQLPTYLLVAPFGLELYFGRIDEADFDALLDSPVRTDLASQLAAGKVGVFVYLPSSDSAANAPAEAVLKELVADVNSGKRDLNPVPGPPAEKTSQDSPRPRLEIGLLEVKRDRAEEKWLLEMLLSMEADLKKEKNPMVFLCYGRGRALLPYIGAGITRENLEYALDFITGACSCTVKEQNPGVDLLARENWEQAARNLAEKFGTEEGNPYGSGSFYPELVIPSDMSSDVSSGGNRVNTDDVVTPAAAVNQALASAPAANSPSATVAVSSTSPKPTDTPAPTAPSPESGQPPRADSDRKVSPPAAATSPPPDTDTTGEATSRDPSKTGPAREKADSRLPEPQTGLFAGAWIVGAGVAVSLVVLFLVTFSVLRPR